MDRNSLGLVSVFRFSEIAHELEIFDSSEVRKMAIKLLVLNKQTQEGVLHDALLPMAEN